MTAINLELLPNGMGRLAADMRFDTPISGYSAHLQDPGKECWIDLNGKLTVCEGFTYDFGSYAIDTPAMIVASAAHDAGCLMTDRGLLPWKVRAQFDQYFRETLKANGVGFARRWWCWTGVRTYSKFVAYWKAER